MEKRIFSVLLALVMCLSLVPITTVTAGATETTEHGFTVTKADGTKASGTDIEESESAPTNVDYYWQGGILYLEKNDLVVSGEGKNNEQLFVGHYDHPVSSVTFQGLSTNNAIYLSNPGDKLILTLKGENQIGCDEQKTEYGMFLNCEMVVTGDGDLTIFDLYDGILPQAEVTTNTDLTFDEKFTGTLTILDEGATLPEPEPQPSCAISIGNATLTVKSGTLNLISKSAQAITANSVSIGDGLVVYAGNSAAEIEKKETYNPSDNSKVVYIASPHCETVNGSNQEFKPWVDNTALPTSGGNWYLTTDTDLTATWSVPTGTTTNLCLNGHVIKASGTNFSVITVPDTATLNLYDCGTTTHDGYIDGNDLWHLGTGGEGTTNKSITGGVITGGTGAAENNENLGGGVYVKAGGSFVMNGGTIAGCSATKGGGVFTWGNMTMNNSSAIVGCTAVVDGGGVCACNCSFTMNNKSEVKNCVAGNGAGGVYTFGNNDTASFIMNGNSTIGECKASADYSDNKRSGGGVCVEGSSFTMNGGTISKNTAAKADGGGVYVYSGIFTMDGGEIKDNVAERFDAGEIKTGGRGGGVFINKGTFSMSNGIIEKNEATISGGGVYVGEKFEMTGGIINNNNATNRITGSSSDGNGGGVFIDKNSEFTMSGNSRIMYNTAYNLGGGVRVDEKGSFTMSEESIISGNKGKTGGGVSFSGNKFNMNGGAIKNNIAVNNGGGVSFSGTEFNITGGSICYNTASNCGGVQLTSGSLKMTKGEITKNTATNYGGVYAGGAITLGGTANITGNVKDGTIENGELTGGTDDNVFLPNNKYITLGTDTDAPAGDMKIGVTTQTAPVDGIPVQITTNGEATDTKYFTPDNTAYEVKYNTNGYLELVATYTVTFDANGHGTAPGAITKVVFGATITAPTTPTVTGYTFGGWFKDAACTNAWNFDTDTVTTNTTLYAKWTKNSSHGGGSYTPGHTVTSDLNNVTKVTIDGKVVDSRYYTVNGGTVYLTGEFMKTLTNGSHTVKLYDGAKVATGIMTVSGNVVVASAATGDMGVALYGVLAISSLLGMGWLGKRKRDE